MKSENMNFVGLFVFLAAATATVTGVVPTAEEVAKMENGKIIGSKQRPLQFQRTMLAPFTRLSVRPFAEEPEECKSDEMTCENDQITFCGFDNRKMTLPCSTLFQGKPGFCDCEKGKCVSIRPQCPNEEEMKCNNPGEKLPDPKDCRVFTYCDGTNKISIKCPTGFTYNPMEKTCHSSSACHVIKCTGEVLELIPFPQAPQYFLFCFYGQGEVRQCSQEGYVMQNGKCQFQCSKPGLFRDPNEENCRKGWWYACFASKNNTFLREKKFCPKNGSNQMYFDEKIGICVKNDICGASAGQGNKDEGVSGIEKSDEA